MMLDLPSSSAYKSCEMEPQVINILLVEDDEVDVMNVRRAFKKGHHQSYLCCWKWNSSLRNVAR
jgi:hypothetical protein